MKALILNSGIGKRMGKYTENAPKCMTMISSQDTIISRQLKQLVEVGIKEIIITTGYFEKILKEYCLQLDLPVQYKFIHNDLYDKTNYIYSIYLAKEFINSDIVLMHGDLVFDRSILEKLIKFEKSCMVVSSIAELSQKDFKAVIEKERIRYIGIDCFEKVLAAQPLYKLNNREWKDWLEEICYFCENEKRDCYAENAFNKISSQIELFPYDIKEKMCQEIDTIEDLKKVKQYLGEIY